MVKVFRLGYQALPPRLNNVFLEAHRKDWTHMLLPDKSVNPFSKQNTRLCLQNSNQDPDFGHLFRKSELERQNRLKLEKERERMLERNDAELRRNIQKLPDEMTWTVFMKDIFPQAVSADLSNTLKRLEEQWERDENALELPEAIRPL